MHAHFIKIFILTLKYKRFLNFVKSKSTLEILANDISKGQKRSENVSGQSRGLTPKRSWVQLPPV